jgi:hypothetical protein
VNGSPLRESSLGARTLDRIRRGWDALARFAVALDEAPCDELFDRVTVLEAEVRRLTALTPGDRVQ